MQQHAPQVQNQADNQRNILQNLDPAIQRKVGQELNTKQFELFRKSFLEHCRRKNLPADIAQMINGTQVSFFILYMYVQKLNGGENVTKAQQWHVLAKKMNIQGPNAGEELAKTYYRYLLPYEKYLMTPDGIKETQTNRIMLQQLLQDIIRTIRTSTQQFQPPVQNQSFMQGQNVIQTDLQMKQQQIPKAPTKTKNTAPKQPKPKPPKKPRVKKKTKKELEQERKQMEELQKRQQQEAEQQQMQRKMLFEQQFKKQQEIILKRREEQIKKLPKVYKRTMARHYNPTTRPITTQNGYDISKISALGEMIHNFKPIFLFAPEFGVVNINAIAMQLQSANNSEVNTALNSLLVISSDNTLSIPLDKCRELLDNLCILACQLLYKLLKKDFSRISGLYTEYSDQQGITTPPKHSDTSDSRIEQIFLESVGKLGGDSPQLTVNVDSLTGIDLSQYPITPTEPEIELDSELPRVLPEKVEDENDIEYLQDLLKDEIVDEIKSINFTSYMDSLAKVKGEVGTIFSKCHTSGAEDPHLLIVDQLTTISMILRNLSFNEQNSQVMANNYHMEKYVADILWMIFIHKDEFIFERRVLNFKKDLIFILSNITHMLKIESTVTCLLIILLTLSFADPKDHVQENSVLVYAEYASNVEKYQTYGVDVLAKLLSLGYPNRAHFKSVLTGVFTEENEDDDLCQHVLGLYNGKESLKLFNDVFSFIISTIPFQQIQNMPNLIEGSLPSVLQALTAAVSIVKFIDTHEEHCTFKNQNLPRNWLTSEENIGVYLRRMSEVFINIASQNNNLREFKDVLSIVSGAAIQLVRLLLEKSLEIASISELPKSARKKTIEDLTRVPNLLPSDNSAITIIMNPTTNVSTSFEMKLFFEVCKNIYSELA